jgi:hypothetical protein
MRLMIALFAAAILAQSQPPVPRSRKDAGSEQKEAAPQKDKVSRQNGVSQPPITINQYNSTPSNREERQAGEEQKQSTTLKDVSDLLLAFFTLILAGATILLARVAYLQWKTMEGHERALSAMASHMESGLEEAARAAKAAADTARIAHENFTHAYRPRLAVRFVTIHGIERFDEVWGEFLAVNVGETKAILKGYWCDVVPLDGSLPTTPAYADKSEKPLANIELLPSESTYVSFPDLEERHRPSDFPEYQLMRQGELYVLGWIKYADTAGREHRKGFAFVYIRNHQRFEPVKQEDYHYDD